MTWRQVQLKQVASVAVSNVDKKSSDHERPVRLCNYVDVYKNDLIDAALDYMRATASPAQIRSFGLRAGDTVITKDSETAKDIAVPAYVGETIEGLVCGYHLAVVRPGPQVDPKYLFWCLSAEPMREQAAVAATGVTRFGLRQESLRNIALSLPSIAEQRRIADFLDAQVARLDMSASLRSHHAALEAERFRAVLDSRMRTPTLVGRTWPRLSYSTSLITSGPRGWSEFVGEAGPAFFRSANLRRDSLRPRLDELAHVNLPPSTLAEAGRSRVRLGDVLVGITGANTGWVTVVQEPELIGAHVSQHVCLVRVDDRQVRPGWLAYHLTSPSCSGVLLGAQYGGTKPQLSLADLRNLRVPLPSLSDQNAWVSELDQQREALGRLVNLGVRQETLLAERKRALITAAVTGQLDVTTARGAA